MADKMHPTILAIDTCEKTCSAAVVRGGATLVSRMEAIGRGHAERLLPMISEMFAEAGLEYDSLSRIAVCTGPGTFTGLRIGLSAARGLALSLGIPCVGLMSLPVLAAQAEGHSNAKAGDTVHAVVMGRGGQGFHQMFRLSTGGVPETLELPETLSAAVSADAEDIQALLTKVPGIVVGSGAGLVAAESDINAVDPVVLGRLCAVLNPSDCPPEPAYLREADAAKATRLIKVEQ